MAEKTSQTSSASNMPNVPAVAPTSDTPYIQPLIGKLGFDTEHPDIFGIGSSPDNGVSFHVWASFKGIIFDKDNIDTIWNNGTSDRVKKEIDSATAEIPAVKSAADEAVKKADSAIASSKVNSDAIANIDSAVSAVKSDTSAAASDAIKNLNDVKSATSSAYAELHSSIVSNQAAIEQNKKDIALKASQTSVDNLTNSVNSQAASLTVMNNVISTKVTSADVEKAIDGKGYVTKDFVESSITQKANTLSESIASVNGQVQNVTASLDGLQSTVKDKVDSSTFTQLAKVVQSKVSSDDFNSKYTQLSNMIDARVSKDDLIGEINLQAGSTLIRNKKIFLDGETVIFGDKTKAFIPSAAITNVDADKVSAGTIKGVNLLINNANDVTSITNTGVTNAGFAPNSKDRYVVTRVDNGVITFGNVSPNDVKDRTTANLLIDAEGLTQEWAVQAKIDQTNLYDEKYSVAQLDKQGVISQSIQDSVAKQKGVKLAVSFYAKADNDGDNLLFSYNKSQASQKLGTDYQKYSYTVTNNADLDSITIAFSGNNDNKGTIYVTEPTVTRQLTDSELAEKAIDNISQSYDSSIFGNDGNLLESSKGTITLHAGDLLNDATQWNSDGTQISRAIPQAEIKLIPSVDGKSGKINLTSSNSVIDMDEDTLTIFNTIGDASRGGGVQIQGLGITGSTVWSSDNYFAIGSQKTQSYTVVNAQSFQSQSVLSSKTRIKRLDRKEALSTIMRDDIYTYLYKSDVQLGLTKRHASLVIDDENDVAQYRAPEEFISESGNARDDGTQLGYLIAAVQYQQEEIEELKNKLEEK